MSTPNLNNGDLRHLAETATPADRDYGFNRNLLPDPFNYYTTTAGLTFRERGGKWRTTRCEFHGSSDSMRINIETGAFVCMAGCGARGGDVIAYEMARTGCDFVTVARSLDCWTEGMLPPKRPTPLPARDAIQLLAAESNLVAIAGCNMGVGIALTPIDLERVLTAASRILKIAEVFA